MCVLTRVCTHACVRMHACSHNDSSWEWRSEDYLWESVFSPSTIWLLRPKLGLSGLVANPPIPKAIFPALNSANLSCGAWSVPHTFVCSAGVSQKCGCWLYAVWAPFLSARCYTSCFSAAPILFVDSAGFCVVSAFSYSDGCYLFLREKTLKPTTYLLPFSRFSLLQMSRYL